MKGINHQITTGCGYFMAMNLCPDVFPWMSMSGLAVSLVGALLPDLDCHTSRMGRIMPFISYPLQGLLGHRGALHSLLAAGLIVYLCYLYQFPWALSLAFGFIAHLLGDACTPSGIAFFWPLGGRQRLPILLARNAFVEAITSGCFVIGAYYSYVY